MIAIIGGGRMGRGLALALAEAGERVQLWSRREAALRGESGPSGAVAGARTVILAVPDDAIAAVAQGLQQAGAIEAGTVVLHLSGLRDVRVLRALRDSGARLGSLHPLQAISDPATAGVRWRGAVASIEGDAEAVAEAERLCRLLGLEPVQLVSAAKTAYHAAAVIASNYVVVLAAVAGRLAREAGVSPDLAARMYLPLLIGTAENLREQLPAEALTGPVRRGDIATIREHLEALGPEVRTLYAKLGLEALVLAREAGLDAARADEVERLLRDY